jgi:autotransporter-associated beta strand protein
MAAVRLARLALATAFVLTLSEPTRGQNIALTWSGQGADANWTTIGNWNLTSNNLPSGLYPNNGQPLAGNTYDVTLSGSPTLNTNITINNFLFTSGTIGGGSNLNVNSLFSWNGGTLGGTGTVTLNGGANVAGTVFFAQPVVNGSGSTVSVTSTVSIYGNIGSAWTNQSGSAFTLTADGGLNNNNASPTFTNSNGATFGKTGGTGSSGVAWTFINNGTVNVTSGILAFNGTNTQNGSMTVGVNGTAQFNGASTWTGTAGSTGAGTVQLFGGTVNFNGTNNLASAVIISPGVTVDGTGAMTISGPLTWNGGFLGASSSPGAGTTTLTGGATINGTPFVNRGVINATGSTVTMSAAVNLYSNSANATWTNQSGSTFSFTNDGNLSTNAGTGVFNNNSGATFGKTGGTGTSNVAWTFTNSGTVNATSGTLVFSGTNTQSGSINAGGGATVQFNGTSTWTGTAISSGSGTVQLFGGSVNFNGTNVLADPVTISPGVTIDGTGAMKILGALTWSGGNLGASSSPGAGTTTISGGATINGTPFVNRGVINTAGSTVTMSAAVNLYSNSANAIWTNQSGSAFNFTNDGNLSTNAGTGVFNNNSGATFGKTGGTGTSNVAWTFTNSGTVNATSGTLVFSGTNTQSGSINAGGGATVQFNGASTWTGTAGSTGAGAVQLFGGTVNFNGTNNLVSAVTISPGVTVDGTGAMTISGPLTWSGGNLGASSSPGAGTTTISGSATINGTPFVNRGVINTAGSTVTMSAAVNLYSNSANAIWTNQSGSAFNFTNDGSLSINAGTGVFNNNSGATFGKTGGTGTSNVAWTFTNSGTVLASSGTLQFGTGTNLTNYTSGTQTLTGGTWRVFAGATLDLSSSRPISTIAAGTTVEVNGLGSTFNTLENHVTANAGTLNILGGRSFTPGGTLTNSGILTVGQAAGDGSQFNAAVNVNAGGTLRGTGTLTGAATLASGGLVSPGIASTFGALAAANWVPQTGSSYLFKYNPAAATPVAGADNDTITAASGALNLSGLSSSNKMTISLEPGAIATPAGGSVTYTAGTFSSVTLPGGVTSANLSTLFTFTGAFSGTPTASLDGTQTKLQFTFTPVVVSSWTWGGNGSGGWNVSGNWNPAVRPVSSSSAQITFGATANPAMTNDIPGTQTVNALTFTAAAPAYTLGGNGLNFQTGSGGAAPQVVSSSPNSVTFNVPLTLTNNLAVSGSGNVTLAGPVGGTGGLTMNGTGTLSLTGMSTYSGGTAVQSGTVAVASDAALGTGNVTGGTLGTLTFTASTTTGKSFGMGGGTITVAAGQTATFIGGAVSAAYLDGAGTFATNGAQMVNVQTSPTAVVLSTSAADQFRHFDNSGALTIAPGVNQAGTSATIHLNGFTNEGTGSVTIGAQARTNVSNFQSYGTLTINPAAATENFSQTTLVTNVGTAPLGFNGGSRTFIGTPQTAVFPNNWPDPSVRGLPTFVAGLDLNGKNMVVANGFFVNNGYVEDSTNNFQGSGTIVADTGGLVKGAGYFQNTVITVNGGKFQAGNSPGKAVFGSLNIGPSGLSNFNWQINNATGTGGPTADANNQVSGWSQVVAAIIRQGPTFSTGNLNWSATNTPGNQFSFSLQTLQNPTTVGNDVQGAMANFDPNAGYIWPVFGWAGAYTGPLTDSALTATVLLDTSNFVNAHPQAFSFHLDLANSQIDLVYGVPEPGTLALGALAALGLIARRVGRKLAKV